MKNLKDRICSVCGEEYTPDDEFDDAGICEDCIEEELEDDMDDLLDEEGYFEDEIDDSFDTEEDEPWEEIEDKEDNK